jgi:hypothetical protein
MNDYTFTCESGAIVLVSADSASEAEADWDEDAMAGNVDPRVTEAEPATADDIEALEDGEHDYRCR